MQLFYRQDRFIRNCFIDKEVYMQLFYLQTTVVEVEKKSEKKKLKEKEFEENGISDEVEVKKRKRRIKSWRKNDPMNYRQKI